MSMYGFTYRGSNVGVPSTADIPTNYQFGRQGAWAVREALGCLEPWDKGDDPIETVQLSRVVPAIVVPTGGRPVSWGKHVGHKAKHVQVSPFIRVGRSLTDLFTIELVGTVGAPSLVRAYPGDYIPPLPWMNSAEWACGGYESCVKFWRTHAYVYSDSIVRSLGDRSPSWFC